MKFRLGNVSNSSTTSFLVYGISMSRSDAEEAIADAIERLGVESKYSWGHGGCLAKAIGVDSESGWEGEYEYFGISPTRIKDDETGAQFKARVKEALSRAFGDDIECDYHEESFYDG